MTRSPQAKTTLAQRELNGIEKYAARQAAIAVRGAVAELATRPECRNCARPVGDGDLACVVSICGGDMHAAFYCARCAAHRPEQTLERLALPLPDAVLGAGPIGPFDSETVVAIWQARRRRVTYPGIADTLRLRGVLPAAPNPTTKAAQERQVKNVVERVKQRQKRAAKADAMREK